MRLRTGLKLYLVGKEIFSKLSHTFLRNAIFIFIICACRLEKIGHSMKYNRQVFLSVAIMLPLNLFHMYQSLNAKISCNIYIYNKKVVLCDSFN